MGFFEDIDAGEGGGIAVPRRTVRSVQLSFEGLLGGSFFGVGFGWWRLGRRRG